MNSRSNRRRDFPIDIMVEPLGFYIPRSELKTIGDPKEYPYRYLKFIVTDSLESVPEVKSNLRIIQDVLQYLQIRFRKEENRIVDIVSWRGELPFLTPTNLFY